LHPNEAHFQAPKDMAETSTLTIATWNVEWATPGSDRGSRCAAVLADARADIIVATEGFRDLLPPDGYTVDAGPDWGYPLKRGRRKVIVWSRFPLILELVGDVGGTRGRLVMATVTTPHAPIRIIGVCIPWHEAHVRSGRRDAQPWSEHMDYLDRLQSLLGGLDDDVPTVIAGDFNQRIPRVRQPIRVFDRLREVLSGWTVHTAGAQPNGPHIDHIATDARLGCETVGDWSAADQRGRLSDHAGVACRITFTNAAARRSVMVAPIAGQDQPKQADTASTNMAPAAPDGGLAAEGPTAPPPRSQSEDRLTPALRAEIEAILRRSSDGLEHGASFRLREQGLTDAEIAAARGVKENSNRVWLRSLDAMLDGYLPKSKTAAEKNSYGYRELLNHARTEALDRYITSQLRKLQELNPAVRIAPLHTRPYQYRVPTRRTKPESQVKNDPCPECGTLHAGEC